MYTGEGDTWQVGDAFTANMGLIHHKSTKIR